MLQINFQPIPIDQMGQRKHGLDKTNQILSLYEGTFIPYPFNS